MSAVGGGTFTAAALAIRARTTSAAISAAFTAVGSDISATVQSRTAALAITANVTTTQLAIRARTATMAITALLSTGQLALRARSFVSALGDLFTPAAINVPPVPDIEGPTFVQFGVSRTDIRIAPNFLARVILAITRPTEAALALSRTRVGLENNVAIWTMKRNDRLPALAATLLDGNGAALNLTGTTVAFHMWRGGASTFKVNASCTVTSAAGGQVSYDWAAGDTDTAGEWQAEFEITYTGPRTLTCPNGDNFLVNVVDTP